MIIVVATKCYLKDEYRNLFENFRNEGLFFFFDCGDNECYCGCMNMPKLPILNVINM